MVQKIGAGQEIEIFHHYRGHERGVSDSAGYSFRFDADLSGL
jgi:hypothetical protein